MWSAVACLANCLHVRTGRAHGLAHASARPDAEIVTFTDAAVRNAGGGPVKEIRLGDVVWFAPGEKHWHSTTPISAVTHIAIQEKLTGKTVDWMEHITDEQYQPKRQ